MHSQSSMKELRNWRTADCTVARFFRTAHQVCRGADHTQEDRKLSIEIHAGIFTGAWHRPNLRGRAYGLQAAAQGYVQSTKG